ncbi:Transcriptional regulator,sugar-binding [Intrasporangium oryzae NRRL B-24470]|uniref:Transcriptional regulator,sugar-binding n=1 Tax=Intrasporangium oryzae NRRL B-24470 TaxID=1386089 RepID=W9G1W4_9MICO|nr:LacI family DNA-binding transcriptional regulator [Intrasporangium oryzae]EWS99954.1 Transcriptional regulator,sugar-binding [Intrasporangium oryzae NRRL B-24470]
MSPTGQARATLRDVAERAGVSVSTASLVFSGKGPVADTTAERVREAARAVGFTGPNPLASSLRQGRAGAVGVLVEGRLRVAFRDPFAISVLDGIAEVLDTIPSGMLLIGQQTGHPDAIVPQLAGLALDAVVFSLCGPEGNPAVDHLAARGIPMFGTSVPDDPRVTHVRIDERAAGAAISRYVHDLGHRRVATVTMPMSPTSVAGPVSAAELRDACYVASKGRLEGFREVFGDEAPALQTGDGSSVEGGLVAGRILLDVDPLDRPTAIVAQSDVIAAGVIRAAEDLGLRVPDDLSVTGFDGVDLPWLAHRLTTMDQQGHEKGRLLGELVRRTLDGEQPGPVTQPVALRVGTTTARAR